MRILLTLDYELFFGARAGTVDACMIRPTEKLLEVLDRYEVKASFFVDASYLEKLRTEISSNSQLNQDYEKITEQIKTLFREGHDIQLHLHPHWQDSLFINGEWQIDARRFRLHDWSQERVFKFFHDGLHLLESILGEKAFVFRAGGWCLQPFEHLRESMRKLGFTVDSTVFRNGQSCSATHYFDFTNVENKTIWKFSTDPTNEDPVGTFWEIPISSIKLSPLFFWRLALAKKFGGKAHKAFGDGQPLPGSRKDLIRMLTRPSYSVVSMDGYKSSLLQSALNEYKKRFADNDYFVVIGHPKALTPYSLQKLDRFLNKNIGQNDFTTYRREKQGGNMDC